MSFTVVFLFSNSGDSALFASIVFLFSFSITEKYRWKLIHQTGIEFKREILLISAVEHSETKLEYIDFSYSLNIMNIYIKLTRQFNDGCLRAILSGGQAVVLHRLAIMSKDGDWIIRENDETMHHILSVLEGYGAHYRFGVPLDIRWLSAGWSSHLEFIYEGLRVRTDFVSRPPRLTAERLETLWNEQEEYEVPHLDPVDLIETKKTNREKDYAVIGELARIADAPIDKLKYSRSARELIELAERYPQQVATLISTRPVLKAITDGLFPLEAALDNERRKLMHANEERLSSYMTAAENWSHDWPDVSREIKNLPLSSAHKLMVKKATGVLPFSISGDE